MNGPLRCVGQVPCRHRLTALVAALAACGRGGRPCKAVVFVSSCDAADFVPRLLQVEACTVFSCRLRVQGKPVFLLQAAAEAHATCHIFYGLLSGGFCPSIKCYCHACPLHASCFCSGCRRRA